MKLNYSANNISEFTVGSIVYFVPEFEKISDKQLKAVDTATSGALTTMLESEEFTGAMGEVASVYHPAGFKAGRVVLVGLGEKKEITPDSFRKAAGHVSRYSGLKSSAKAVFYFGKFDDERFYQAVIEGYLLGSWKLLDYKTGDAAEDKTALKEITFVIDNPRQLKRLEKAVERGFIIGEGQTMVRELAFTPSNFLTPQLLSKKAQQLARKYKFTCRVLDEKAIAKEKMGALESVARGSNEPPRFIILEYKGAPAGRKPIVLVGKGVTFDSGGISLKPGLNMHEMKGDMTGAAVVLSTIVTAARLKLPQNVTVLIPATENMPSGKATRPGDIITARNGKTIEIINTDAEGRLILADALDYANEFKPQAVLDIATLTGASLFVLGYSGAPIMGNNDKLLTRVKEASEATAERVWELPLWDDFYDRMKSSIADLVNSGGRAAGTACAGAFLENFIGDYPWAHIDIAYVDLEPKGRPYIPAGPTGIGLRLLIEVLSAWKKL